MERAIVIKLFHDHHEENSAVACRVSHRYDMKYDGRYSSFKLVEGLAMALGLADPPPDRELGGEG